MNLPYNSKSQLGLSVNQAGILITELEVLLAQVSFLYSKTQAL